VPIRVELRTERGEVIRNLADPSGGTFDAAGDFDRLLTNADGLMRGVDPYGDTVFNRIQADDLVNEVDRLATANDATPMERRGLARLRVMAERCRDSVHLYLWFIGD
jgi:hypothetical protein